MFRHSRTQAIGRLLLLFLLMLVIGVGGLFLGRGDLEDAELGRVFLRLRLLRTGAAMLTGASLSVAGVLVQGLLRNPLASPSILGTTAGATLGGQIAMLLAGFGGGHLVGVSSEMLLPVGALLGALLSLFVLLSFLRRGASVVTLLLIGFALSSLLLSIGTFLTSWAQEDYELGRAVLAFTLGGFEGMGEAHLRLAAPLLLSGVLAAWFWSRSLDVLLSGEDEAQTLGLDVVRVRRWVIVWIAVLTAAAVAVGGNIAFVGLVVPHALRPLFGAEHQRLIPAAAFGGAAFVMLCDLVVRVAPTRAVMPLGIVTGLIGAPLFLFLLLRTRQEWLHDN